MGGTSLSYYKMSDKIRLPVKLVLRLFGDLEIAYTYDEIANFAELAKRGSFPCFCSARVVIAESSLTHGGQASRDPARTQQLEVIWRSGDRLHLRRNCKFRRTGKEGVSHVFVVLVWLSPSPRLRTMARLRETRRGHKLEVIRRSGDRLHLRRNCKFRQTGKEGVSHVFVVLVWLSPSPRLRAVARLRETRRGHNLEVIRRSGDRLHLRRNCKFRQTGKAGSFPCFCSARVVIAESSLAHGGLASRDSARTQNRHTI